MLYLTQRRPFNRAKISEAFNTDSESSLLLRSDARLPQLVYCDLEGSLYYWQPLCVSEREQIDIEQQQTLKGRELEYYRPVVHLQRHEFLADRT